MQRDRLASANLDLPYSTNIKFLQGKFKSNFPFCTKMAFQTPFFGLKWLFKRHFPFWSEMAFQTPFFLSAGMAFQTPFFLLV